MHLSLIRPCQKRHCSGSYIPSTNSPLPWGFCTDPACSLHWSNQQWRQSAEEEHIGTENAEIAVRLRRIATSLETSADTSEALASQLLETHVALLCTHMGSLPTSSGSSSSAQLATQRLLPMTPKRLPRPNQALRPSFTEVHAARAQARVAEHVRNNLLPRRRICKCRKEQDQT